ncbi:Prostamide/prostaglandin F synthase [Acropora cervicornis]|uniref:Prostamide/prostaglandin F synthase n=1 Tax=Acropora cervicornis TaxID=6130 RepID=A0AAD9US65_ACRCE|nr:Prostamide/prostaglandin F synthase [Acropora cervicornis]
MDVSKVAQNVIKYVTTGELCGIGLEEFGVEEFQEGKFFTGELYLDTKQECYNKLGFKRYNMANAKGIKGNFRGDGLLNGGMLIVTAGGEKVLLSHKQASPGDHVSNEKIFEVLGITAEAKKEETEAAGGVAQESS